MPPVGFTVAPPLLNPLHVTFESTSKLAKVNGLAGCVILAQTETEQPFASVTVTHCEPTGKLLAVAVV